MKEKNKNQISRRRFIETSAVVAATAAIVPLNFSCKGSNSGDDAAEALPNSRFGGVQIGNTTYSWRDMPGGVDNIIKYCKETGISSMELLSNDLEDYLGAPKNPMMEFMRQMRAAAANSAPTASPVAPAPPAGGFQMPPLSPEQQAAVDKYNEDIKAWRLAVPMTKYEGIRKLFNDAGISIHIAKFSPATWSDEEIDYSFRAAKALGAKGVCDEISYEACRRLAPFAEKHGLYAIFHQHMQFANPSFSYNPLLDISPAIMLNFDTGHYFGSTGVHPCFIIEKYKERILSVHLKDKTSPFAAVPNTNQVWGQGETPIEDILKMIQNQKLPIHCDIELEYEIKPWSDSVKEVKTCVNYCRQILI
jgi:sugar phosphate isomerase/epimerase